MRKNAVARIYQTKTGLYSQESCIQEVPVSKWLHRVSLFKCELLWKRDKTLWELASCCRSLVAFFYPGVCLSFFWQREFMACRQDPGLTEHRKINFCATEVDFSWILFFPFVYWFFNFCIVRKHSVIFVAVTIGLFASGQSNFIRSVIINNNGVSI